jgi:hypothetical protein
MEPPITAQGGGSVHRTSPNDWFEPDTHRPSQPAKYLVIANDVPNDLVDRVSVIHAQAVEARLAVEESPLLDAEPRDASEKQGTL